MNLFKKKLVFKVLVVLFCLLMINTYVEAREPNSTTLGDVFRVSLFDIWDYIRGVRPEERYDFKFQRWGFDRRQVMYNEKVGNNDSRKVETRSISENLENVIGWIPPKDYPYLSKTRRSFDYKVSYIEGDVGGRLMDLDYYFLNNELVAVRYRMKSNVHNYVNEYYRYVDKLNVVYGNAIFDDEHWHIDNEMVHKTISNGSVSQGWVSLNHIWETDTTIIYSRLHRKRMLGINLDILYLCKDFADKIRIDKF